MQQFLRFRMGCHRLPETRVHGLAPQDCGGFGTCVSIALLDMRNIWLLSALQCRTYVTGAPISLRVRREVLGARRRLLERLALLFADRQFVGSNPPDDTGNFNDSAHVRPVVATPETSRAALPKILLGNMNDSWEAPQHPSKKGGSLLSCMWSSAQSMRLQPLHRPR